MADRLLDKIHPPIRRVDIIKFPGTDKDAGLLQMVCSELEDADIAAIERLNKRGLDLDKPYTDNLLSREVCINQILIMMVDPESKGQKEHRLFKDADEVRKMLTDDQREWIIQQHILFSLEDLKTWSLPENDKS